MSYIQPIGDITLKHESGPATTWYGYRMVDGVFTLVDFISEPDQQSYRLKDGVRYFSYELGAQESEKHAAEMHVAAV